jgi:Fe-S-cluster containining protein
MTENIFLSAGNFSSWLASTRLAHLKNKGVDVSCGSCIACCRSSYFIHIRPYESQTLAIIPKELLFPAPGLSKGNMVLGYDEEGHCPMLADNKCSIYDYRPLTCRTYDCRIFTAAGIAAGDDDKVLITRQSQRWKFNYPDRQDHKDHLAVKTAAKFLQKHTKSFPNEISPRNPSQVAILAIKVYDVFSEFNKNERPDQELIKDIIKANGKFEDI